MFQIMIDIAVFWGYVSAASTTNIPEETEYTNSIGMRFVRIESGSFEMGSKNGDFDEQPVHKVNISNPFYMAVTEVNNAQYEQFNPQHNKLRGKWGFSKEDDEAVVFVSWHEAVAFCEWLSKKEGVPYRLPTEAEWEYACRAGTNTAFNTGSELPEIYHKNQKDERIPKPLSLEVGKTPANTWGLCDMHGNVEEWCYDWYGSYVEEEQIDPVGYVDGDFKVTRSGSHNVSVYYLRSANRLGTLPEDKNWLIGFRVVIGEMPKTIALTKTEKPLWASNVSQKSYDWSKTPDMNKSYFKGPIRYVKVPEDSNGPMFSRHNHDAAITACSNGELLAIWYSCNREPGRELTILASRLRRGSENWEPAAPFWDAPDRNDHAPAIWFDGKDTIYHFNGLSAGCGFGRNLALIMRTSKDNGVTWSKARLINPKRGIPSQPVPSVFRTSEGYIVLQSDSPWDVPGGATALWISKDDGQTWNIPDGRIAGIHAGVTQLKDGRLMALGRGHDINERMPKSISEDMGETWNYSATEFSPIGANQRLVLMRLRNGAILMISFTHDFFKYRDNPDEAPPFFITDVAGRERRIYGMFAALSFDEGETWPIKKPITPSNSSAREVSYMDRDTFMMDTTHAEPRGYLDATQTPDGLIHLISSALYYRFNLTWIKTPIPAKSE